MSIKLIPVNKMLLVEREFKKPEKQDQFGFVLPEKIDMSKHIVVRLKNTSEGSTYERYVGQNLLVVRAMIEDVEINGATFQIISENGVVGIAAEGDFL